MKTAYILVLALVMMFMISHVSANGTIAQYLRDGEVAQTTSGEPEGIWGCIQSIWNVAMWGYSLFQAIVAEDMAKILALVTEGMAIIQALVSNCL